MGKSSPNNFENLLLEKKEIVFFDGKCSLCHWSVALNEKLCKQSKTHYGTLQGFEKELQTIFEQEVNLNTVLLYKGKKWYSKTDVVLNLALNFKQPQRFFYRSIRFIPKKLRDALYDFTASHRYRWFGQKEKCQLPDISLRDRLLPK